MYKDQLQIKMTGKDEAIPTASFLLVMSHFLRILKDVEMGVSQEHKASLKWAIQRISMNSPLLLEMYPTAAKGDDYGQDVLTYAARGLKELQENENALPAYFTNRALSSAKTIADTLRDGIRAIDVFTPYSEPFSFTLEVAHHVDALAPDKNEVAYVDFGEFEGRLASMSDHDDKPTVKIEDNIYGYITCSYAPDLVDELKNNLFTERVSVFGETKYSTSGAPLAIHIERIKRLPGPEHRTSYGDLRGIRIETSEDELIEFVGSLFDAD